MKKILIIMAFFIISCQNGIDIDTTKYTAMDPIADITFLNDFFYTTNFDLSYNAGPQIDLYQFDFVANPVNRFELSLNGQGYLAICNDGSNLFLQPRFTDLIFKLTPLGEIFWHQSDNFPDNTADTTSTFMFWRGRGLAWADTNLVALYRHIDDSTLYRGRYIHVNDDSFQTVLDITVTWDHLNSNGAYAMAYNHNPDTPGFWVLATDNLNQYILFEVNANLAYEGNFDVINGNPMGITIGPDAGVYLSYPERKIEKLFD